MLALNFRSASTFNGDQDSLEFQNTYDLTACCGFDFDAINTRRLFNFKVNRFGVGIV